MEDDDMVTLAFALIFGLVGGLILLGGYLIRERRQLRLLAGYDPAEVSDPEGLARYAGKVIYQMGFGTLLVPIIVAILPDLNTAMAIIGPGYLIFILFMVLRLVVGSRRFMN